MLPAERPSMKWNPGKVVIGLIFAVALSATVFSLWYHQRNSRRALAYWGTSAGTLIAGAPEIEVLALGTGESSRQFQVDGQKYTVTAAADASQAPGVSNIRRAMVLDVPFRWDAPPPEQPPAWQYAMLFSDGEESTIVLFDFDSGHIGTPGGSKALALRPEAIDDWRLFFHEQFEPD